MSPPMKKNKKARIFLRPSVALLAKRSKEAHSEVPRSTSSSTPALPPPAAAAAAAAAVVVPLPPPPFPFSPTQSFLDDCRGGRRTYRSERIVAALSVTLTGYALTDGVETVSRDGIVRNSDLVRELLRAGVATLYCTDPKTLARARVLKECYPCLRWLRCEEVDDPEDPDERTCPACGSRKCHKFRAAALFARLRGVPVEVMPH